MSFITEFQKRKRKFSLKDTKAEFDFNPVYNEPPPEFFEFKPVVNDVFRALIAARYPISTSPSTINSEAITTHTDHQHHEVHVANEDGSYVPTGEVRIIN